MPPLHLLIKPASGNCNMRCRYCFYYDITENREIPSFGMMHPSTLEAVLRKGLDYATGECTIAFQGGEPTLAGLDFYRHVVELEQKYNQKGLPIHNALQTNGYLIDKEWARFLAENRFLVGLSLDGHKDLHDLYRFGPRREGTYKTVMHAVQLFQAYGVEFNILTVITAQTAKNAARLYGFFKRNRLPYQQYIPCLDPIGEDRGKECYSLTPPLYAQFLKTMFDLWYQDVSRGEFAYNRYFENLVGMLLGYAPESCGMIGHCSLQTVVEADGGVYPCDFYVLDEYRLGNLTADSFEAIEQRRREIGFIEASMYVSPECRECRWRGICRGGCRRDREPLVGGKPSLNYFCSAYQEFFSYAGSRLEEIARRIQSSRGINRP